MTALAASNLEISKLTTPNSGQLTIILTNGVIIHTSITAIEEKQDNQIVSKTIDLTLLDVVSL